MADIADNLTHFASTEEYQNDFYSINQKDTEINEDFRKDGMNMRGQNKFDYNEMKMFYHLLNYLLNIIHISNTDSHNPSISFKKINMTIPL